MAMFPNVDSRKTEAFSAERELLTNALRSGWANGDGDTEHRQTLRQLCTRAGDQPELREQLLVTFRTIVIAAADNAQIPFGARRNVLLGRLATIFVEEFYSIPLAGRDGLDGDHRGAA